MRDFVFNVVFCGVWKVFKSVFGWWGKKRIIRFLVNKLEVLDIFYFNVEEKI